MNRFAQTSIASLALALVFAAPSAAQEQTPENAQKFLAQIGGLGQLVYASHTARFGYDQGAYSDESGTHYFPKPAFPATEVVASSPCSTQFKYTDTHFSSSQGASTQRAMGGYINWSRVASVTVSGAEVEVVSPTSPDVASLLGPSFYERFTLPNEALAKRVGYAMEFLRLSCDQTEGTGF